MFNNNDLQKILIKNFIFYVGYFDFLKHLEEKIKQLIDNIIIDYSIVKYHIIEFLHIEFLTSHEMKVLYGNTTTDILTFRFQRFENIVDAYLYIDPLLVFLFVQNNIEFENSFLIQTLDNRILELINHGIFHAIGLEHDNKDMNIKMIDIEKYNLAIFSNNINI
jgi:ssRNA-specific RNase YbeY (16S rRNA maturation enzyme)